MARTAQVKRDARIGEAEAKRDSGIKVMNIIIVNKNSNNSCHIKYESICVLSVLHVHVRAEAKEGTLTH